MLLYVIICHLHLIIFYKLTELPTITYKYVLRNNNGFFVPQTKNEYLKRFPFYTFPLAWNNLSLNLKLTQNIKIFRMNLKSYLMLPYKTFSCDRLFCYVFYFLCLSTPTTRGAASLYLNSLNGVFIPSYNQCVCHQLLSVAFYIFWLINVSIYRHVHFSYSQMGLVIIFNLPLNPLLF